MEYGKSEYLKVNREHIDQLVENVDQLMRDASYNYVMRKDSEDMDAYFVGGQASAEDGIEYFKNVSLEYAPTEDEIRQSADDYNNAVIAQSNLSIGSIQAFVSMADVATMTEEELAQPWDGSLTSYEVAEHSGAKISSDLRLTHTTLKGVKGIDINSAEEITIAHTSADGLLRRTFIAIYIDGEPVSVSLDFTPEQDDQMQQWEEMVGSEAVAGIYAITVLGMRDTEGQFEPKLQELGQQLLAEGQDKADVMFIMNNVRERVSALKEDMKFRSSTNIGEPTVDDLLEFSNILKDHS